MAFDRVIVWIGAATIALLVLAVWPIDLFAPEDRAYHDTYYVVVHWHMLLGLAGLVSCVIGLVWVLRRPSPEDGEQDQ